MTRDPIWQPGPERVAHSGLQAFRRWLLEGGRPVGDSYRSLWQWSVEDLDGFWSAVAEYFGVVGSRSGPAVLPGPGAEGARWFPGVQLNYVDRLLHHPPERTAIVAWSELGEAEALTYGELVGRAGALAGVLVDHGVGPGDRVAAVLTNSGEAAIASVAVASIGAVWSSCAPEFGVEGMRDRFGQIEPRALIATDGYQYRGRWYELSEKIQALEESLASLALTVIVPAGGSAPAARPAGGGPPRISWDELPSAGAPLLATPVPFEHPLWILYSSGTTGPPKALVHSHGGIVLEHLKAVHLHCDVSERDRFFWYTNTGWMMWNFLMGGLLVGTTVACYDGHPAWPDPLSLWRAASEHGVTYFGTSAPFLESCRRDGLVPREAVDLTAVHSVGSTGAPLSPEGHRWATGAVGDDVLVGSISGGTDVCTAFLGPCPELAVSAGELQCRLLGAAVEAYDPAGQPLVDEVGELVVTAPMPSMPLTLYGERGAERLHATYFSTYEHLWLHGDWVRITPDGAAVVLGRSDATLNRGGVRMGTAEFYRVVDGLAAVADSLVVDLSVPGSPGTLVLLVVAAETAEVDDEALTAAIRRQIRSALSPRHVPDRIEVVPALPHTINGKKLEVPLKRILSGEPTERALSPSAVDDAGALEQLLAHLADRGVGTLAASSAAPATPL